MAKERTHLLRGMVMLLFVTLCGYGIYAIIEQITNKNDFEKYVSIADSVLTTRQIDTTQSKNTYKNYKQRQFKPLHIELNSADTTQLKRVYGIGTVFARRIVEYRKKLGGYVNVEQLMEVKGINEERFDGFRRNFYVDSAKIQKINVNFVTSKLKEHPYVSASMAKRIGKYINLKKKTSKGGILNLEELVENDIILPNEARKVAPYFDFKQIVN